MQDEMGAGGGYLTFQCYDFGTGTWGGNYDPDAYYASIAMRSDGPCGQEVAGLDGAVGDVGVQTASEGSWLKAATATCTQPREICESSCRSLLTLGVSDYSDQLGFFLAMGGIYAQQRLDKWTLGTAARLAVVRACVSSSSYAAGVAGAWFAGVATGCHIACRNDPCAYTQ
jgi:hypothetical protein